MESRVPFSSSSGPPFTCDLCLAKSYTSKKNLWRHQKYECENVSEKPVFVCSLCNHVTRQKTSLKRHITVVHKVLPSEIFINVRVVVPDISMVLENSLKELKSYKSHSKSIKRWQESHGSLKNSSNRMDSVEKLPADTELISVTPTTPFTMEAMSPRTHFSPSSSPIQKYPRNSSGYASSPSFSAAMFPESGNSGMGFGSSGHLDNGGGGGGPFGNHMGFDILQGAPADFPSVVRTEIKHLLERSNDGLSILVYFEKNQTLSNSLRSKLVQIVIENECRGDPGRKITTDRFIELAAQIAKTFPNESPASYYVPFSIENGRQKNAQGKLWARYNNQKRLYRSTGLLKSARQHDSLFSDMFFLSAR